MKTYKKKNKKNKRTIRLRFKGGKLNNFLNCDTKDELIDEQNSYVKCISKQDTYDNTTLVLIETSTAGNKQTSSTPIIDNIFNIIEHYDFSPFNTYLFSDYKAFMTCVTQLEKNVSNTNIFKNIINRCNNTTFNRKISKKIKYNNNSKKNYEIALHFIQSIKELGHTELLEDININNSNAQNKTLELFNNFIFKLTQNVKTKNLIISMQGHGSDNLFGLLDNPKPELTITSEEYYSYVLKPLETVNSIENIIIIANHCEAETFYKPLFKRINGINEPKNFVKPYTKNVFMIKLQMNILKIPFYNTILTTDFVMDEDYTIFLPYDDVKDNEYKGVLLKDLITKELYETITGYNTMQQFIGTCSRAGGSELYRYIELLYSVSDFEELKNILIYLYIENFGTKDFSGELMSEYWDNYDSLHELIKDELKSQLFKIYISNNSNMSSLPL